MQKQEAEKHPPLTANGDAQVPKQEAEKHPCNLLSNSHHTAFVEIYPITLANEDKAPRSIFPTVKPLTRSWEASLTNRGSSTPIRLDRYSWIVELKLHVAPGWNISITTGWLALSPQVIRQALRQVHWDTKHIDSWHHTQQVEKHRCCGIDSTNAVEQAIPSLFEL